MKKKVLASTIAFFVGSGSAGVLGEEDVGGGETGWLLEEVVVTASKRGKGVSIQDTPMSITALSRDTIENRNLLELEDFVSSIAGVSLQVNDATDKRILIRGLGIPSDQNTGVSTYLGEIPLSIANVGSVDLRLVDIERIEVLKGPQGTLYGSGASSGTLRYVPVAPNLDTFEGSLKVDVATLEESDDTSQSFIGAVNTPLISETLALRVAAYHFEDAGYIDSVSTPAAEAISAATGAPIRVEDDINSGETSGIRAIMLWQASDDLEVNVTLGAQRQDYDGYARTSLELGGYKTSTITSDLAENDADYANLTLNYDLDWGTLTSSTSMLERNGLVHSGDFHFLYARNSERLGPRSVNTKSEVEITSQEFRLSSELEGPLQFIAGLYYEDVQTQKLVTGPWSGTRWMGVEGATPFDGNLFPGVNFAQVAKVEYQQQAIFGELYYELTDQWELSLGARYFDYDREDFTTSDLDQNKNPITFPAPLDASKKGDTYKMGLNYTPNDDTLLYALWSEGFRLGKGQNLATTIDECDSDGDGLIDAFPGAEATDQIEPDTTENFELGAKFSLLDSRLTINTAIYHITWENLPNRLRDGTSSCVLTNNVGEAESEGVEVELAYLLNESLKVDFSMAYNEARVTKATEESRLEVGERLSYAPYTNASIGLEYSFDLGASPAFVRTDVNYFGETETFFEWLDLPTAGDYIDVGLRLGVSIDQWDLAVYGSNLLNEDKIVGVSNRTVASARLRPRKLGFEAKYSF